MAPIHRSPEPTFRFVTTGLLLLGLLSTFPLSVAAEDDLSREEAQKKLDETSQKLQSSRAQEEGLTQDVAALAEARAKLNSDLIEAGKQVQASEAKLSGTEAKLAELTDQVTVIRNSITDRKETIVKMLSAMQRIGRTPPPALVTRRDDALAVVRSAMLLAQVFPELKYQADNLSQELDGLVKLETGIREQRDAEKSEADRLAAERGRIDKLLEEKKTKLAESEAELSATRQAAEQQAAEETELNALIARLDERIAKAEVAQYDAEVATEKALRAREQQQALATPGNEKVIEIKPKFDQDRLCQPCSLEAVNAVRADQGNLASASPGQAAEALRRGRRRRRHVAGHFPANPWRSTDNRPNRRLGGLCRALQVLWQSIDHQCWRRLSCSACGNGPHRRKPWPVCLSRRAGRGDGRGAPGRPRQRR